MSPPGKVIYANQAFGGAPPTRRASPHRPSLNSESGAKENRFHVTYAFNRLGESLAGTLHKGDHVLVDGMLVNLKYDRENGKAKKAKAVKVAIF